MKQFALGCLMYDPERFGKMMVGDFLDAMAGYNQGEQERLRNLAELVRTSTALLWNIQVAKNDKLRAADLWPLPWDTDQDEKIERISEQEYKRRQKASIEWVTKHFPN